MKLEAKLRSDLRKSETKKLRREQRVPATIYGKTVDESVSVSLNIKDVEQLFKKEGRNAVFELEVQDNGTFQAMISDVENDVISRQMLNLQIRALEAGQLITIRVPVELVGGEKIQDGIIDQTIYDLEVEAAIEKIPASFTVDISHLKVGDNIRADEVEIGEATLIESPDATVVSIVIPSVYEEAADEEEGAEAGEETGAEDAAEAEEE